MFVRRLKNRSGSTSIQIINKARGKYKVVKTVGCATTQQEIDRLISLANQEIKKLSKQTPLFHSEKDELVEEVFSSLTNSSIQTIGPELIYGKIFDYIGFNKINNEIFRHLVIARLAFPLSKLKTIDYLYRYQGVLHDVDAIYRFLDKLNNSLKTEVEQIAYSHTLRVLDGRI
ncbi:MAG: transposase, partial [Bacteroidales bacterium]